MAVNEASNLWDVVKYLMNLLLCYMNQFAITHNKDLPSVFSNFSGAQQQKLTRDARITQQHLGSNPRNGKGFIKREGHVATRVARRLKGQEAMTGQGTESRAEQRKRTDSKCKQLEWKNAFADLFMHADE